MENGPWRKTMSSRCNSYCWPPAVSRWTDRFAGFSRLLRNHQSYSAIWSDVAPRDTCAIVRCSFFYYDHPQLFRLSTPSTNHTRFCINVMYRNIIQLFYLSKICSKPSWTRTLSFSYWWTCNSNIKRLLFQMFYLFELRTQPRLEYFKNKCFIIFKKAETIISSLIIYSIGRYRRKKSY